MRFKHPLLDPISRERNVAFARFLWHRFLDDKCFEAAGALSYTTIFALVPLTTAVFGVLSIFPSFEPMSERVTDFVFRHFVPGTARAVQRQLLDFAANATALTTAGILALLVSALLLMSSIEETFNRIWRAPQRRKLIARVLIYWTALTMGPLLAAAAFALGTDLMQDLISGDGANRLAVLVLAVVPHLFGWAAFTLAYLVVPNAPVHFRHAALGGLVAALLFELSKAAFARWFSPANYEGMYGAFAVLPIFLVWVYVSWSVLLLGASFAASLSGFRFQPAALRTPPGLEFAALLRTLRRIAAAARRGEPLTRAQLSALEPGLTDEQIDRFLVELTRAKLVQGTAQGGLVPLRDAREVSLRELFESGGYRLPTAAELERIAQGAERDDDPLLPWLESGRAALHATLSTPVSVMIDAPESDPVPGTRP